MTAEHPFQTTLMLARQVRSGRKTVNTKPC
jgi:hypothetical protein